MRTTIQYTESKTSFRLRVLGKSGSQSFDYEVGLGLTFRSCRIA
jgi:hypothetical protein